MLASLANSAHKLKFLVNNNSPVLLTGVGVVGTVATAYLTGRASFRAAEVIAREKKIAETELRVEGMLATEPRVIPASMLSRTDQVKLVWTFYILPVAAGGITIAAIIMAHRISSKRLAALVIASGISERALQEYKDKVIEKIGPRQEEKLRDEIAQDQVMNTPDTRGTIIMGTGEVLCFDTLTGRYFHSTIEEIKRAENRVNYEIIHYYSASLTMFYEEIGLPPTDYTDSVGWNSNNLMEVKLSTVMSQDNRPCVAIGFTRNPIPDYDKHWEP